jgi:hypothetical protein
MTVAYGIIFCDISGKRAGIPAENAVPAVHRAGGNSSQIFSEINRITRGCFAGKTESTENKIN